MKIKIPILLLAFFTNATLSSLFAEVNQNVSIEQQSNSKNRTYSLELKAPEKPVIISLTLGSSLCITGDQQVELVGGNEMKNVGCRYFDGTHVVSYQGGIGAKEGTKTTYNVSLWSFDECDYKTSIENQSNPPLEMKAIHNIRGLWKFEAVNPTPQNTPQELTFTNQNGSVATIQVIIRPAE